MPKQAPVYTCLQFKSSEKTGKGEIALNEQFLLFQQCFYPFGELSAIFIFYQIKNFCLQTLSVLKSLKSVIWERFNPFPHNKILDQTKWKAFADNKLNVTKMIFSVFDKVENTEGKGEIASISNFSFSHNVFKRLLSKTHQKVSLCGNGLNLWRSSNALNSEESQILVFSPNTATVFLLTLSQTTKFRLFQIQSACRRQS